MAHASTITYRCSRCGAVRKRAELVAVKVSFNELGPKGKTLRTRTTEWLCPQDVAKDPIYNSPAFSPSSPLVQNSTEQLVLFGG